MGNYERFLVEGVNVRKKHQKPRRGGQKGQIIEKALPIHVSNVMLLDPKTGKQTRVGIVRKDGKRTRVTKKSKSELV
jgi:large subunit ribosomal protein L24